MFRTNAFGQRTTCMPRLRFLEGDENGGGGAGAGSDTDLGFPPNTPWRDMEPEQQVAYWRYQSRKHEGVAESRKDYDDIKAKADQFDQLQQQNQTDQERAIEQAREEARREGENLGAERYLKDAVTASFGALTGMSREDVDKAFAHIDVHSFVGQDGALDNDALTEFASTFGTNSGGGSSSQQIDPVKAALERQRGGGTGGGDGSGSITAIREAAREKLAPAKK